MRLALILIAAIAPIALAACAKSEEASLVPPQEDEGYNMVDPVGDQLPQNEVAIGEWTEAQQEERPALQFGPPLTQPLFSMRCDPGRELLLQRHGVIAGPGMSMMTVDVGTASRRLGVTATEGAVPLLRAEVPRSAELVGELATATDRVTVRIGNSEPLVMPASPLIGSFVRRCSEGEAETPAVAGADPEEPAANAAVEAPARAPARR